MNQMWCRSVKKDRKWLLLILHADGDASAFRIFLRGSSGELIDPGLVSPPRVQQSDARCLEITDVSRDHSQIMHQGGRRDERIPLRPRIRYVQPGAASGHGSIHRQDALREGGKDVLVEPTAEDGALGGIAAFDEQDAHLKLQYGDGDMS